MEKPKTVGRPKKPKNNASIAKEGISQTPTDSDNKVEYFTENVSQFKLLFSYLEKAKCEFINMRFTPDDITIFTKDKDRISKIMVRINCADSIWYYCDSELWVSVNCSSLEKLFLTINKKQTSKMRMVIKQDDLEHLIVLLSNENKESNCRIALGLFQRDEELFSIESIINSKDTIFPVEFTLNSKEFKTIISSLKKISDVMVIEKTGDEPLQITSNKIGVQFSEIFKSDSKIDLKTNIGEDNFRAEIVISNIIALSKSIVTPSIRIMCNPGLDFIFECVGDNDSEISMSIYTVIRSVAKP